MRHRFKQPYRERDALRAFSDTAAVLHELVGPLAHASERPHGYCIIQVYAAFTDGFDKAHRERDMLAIHALCRYAKGAAVDVLLSVEGALDRGARFRANSLTSKNATDEGGGC